ncbi:ATP-dependent DNA ligase [Streptomyces sp. Isolate_45]|uniref:ATP-dependent DNA ligase n=1 Tax=Streptomyces sp. Isolate_45 TaxID=2950111 RepID=UPI002481B3C3|nr:ATP-dependent DNA ligase [Streptomyces sp. Isolate_45]MDA5286306.1 ATP-dependent DNA ligase [Streptomyces sp. Isolate_45]
MSAPGLNPRAGTAPRFKPAGSCHARDPTAPTCRCQPGARGVSGPGPSRGEREGGWCCGARSCRCWRQPPRRSRPRPDGHRTLVFTPDGPGGRVLLQTRRGVLVQDAFPDLVAAASRLPDGLVLDGEVLAWDVEAEALSFEGLQRRAAARARTAPALVARLPALYVAFDVLQQGGVKLLTLSYRERRRRLEVLFAARALTSPWTLCPMTTDHATATQWLETWTEVIGIEGVLAKPMGARYLQGHRGWTKIKRRDTTEAVIGAITGTLTRPRLLVLGRHDHDGRLRAVGRTVTLRPEQAREVAEHLAPAVSGHPWEGVRFVAAWGC